MMPIPTDIPRERQPRHVAIIMDGNGRWASQRSLPRNEGHRKGVENVRRIIEAAGDYALDHLTLFAFSAENWKRPREEVDALMQMLSRFLNRQKKDLDKHRIRLRVVGGEEGMPPAILKSLRKIEEQTQSYRRYSLNLALNYGSRQEMVAAVNRYLAAVQAGQVSPPLHSWEDFIPFLQTADIPDPDLIIRTSGEYRVSNFLLLQGAYAEYYFTPVLWPDFGPERFAEAIADYASRQRRFGLSPEQIVGTATRA